MTYQEYAKHEKKDGLKFDVAHLFHSLYYAGLETALEHCYEKELGTKGVILCFINDVKSAMSKHYKAFSSHNAILSRGAYYDSKEVTGVAETERLEICAVSRRNHDL